MKSREFFAPRDIIFYENIFPFSKKSINKGITYSFLVAGCSSNFPAQDHFSLNSSNPPPDGPGPTLLAQPNPHAAMKPLTSPHTDPTLLPLHDSIQPTTLGPFDLPFGD